jgi:tetratricopeptide (TPR) repeat protein
MIMQEGSRALGEGAAIRQRQDRAYFLDLMGDSLRGLGRDEAAIDAYRQAAQAFEARGARCSYALGLLKIADCHLALREPWHAIGYLEACLPLLRELNLVRHLSLAQRQLDACQATLAQAGLLDEVRTDQRPASTPPPPQAAKAAPPQAARPAPRQAARPAGPRAAPPPQAAKAAGSAGSAVLPPGRG